MNQCNPRVIDLQNETTTMQMFLVVYHVWLQICIILLLKIGQTFAPGLLHHVMTTITPLPTCNISHLPLPSCRGRESNKPQAVGQIEKEAKVYRYSKEGSILCNTLVDKYGQCPYFPSLAVVLEVWDKVVICSHQFVVSCFDIGQILNLRSVDLSIRDTVWPPISERGGFVRIVWR